MVLLASQRGQRRRALLLRCVGAGIPPGKGLLGTSVTPRGCCWCWRTRCCGALPLTRSHIIGGDRLSAVWLLGFHASIRAGAGGGKKGRWWSRLLVLKMGEM